MSKMKLIFWDWKEQLPLDRLNEALKEFRCRIVEIDSGSDANVVVIGPITMTEEQANKCFEDYLDKRR